MRKTYGGDLLKAESWRRLRFLGERLMERQGRKTA